MKKIAGMILALSGFMLLSGCLTLSGHYQLTVVDANGNNLRPDLRLHAHGSGIYTARDALCLAFPGSIVHIKDSQTGKELRSKSPYKCRK